MSARSTKRKATGTKTAAAPGPAAVSPQAAAAVAQQLAGASEGVSVIKGRPDYVKGARYTATRPFTYGDKVLISGQVVKLGGFINDEKLVRLEYFRPWNEKVTGPALPCRLCGEVFETERFRMAHGGKVHERQRENPMLRLMREREYALDPRHLGRPRTDMEQFEIDDLGRRAAEWEENESAKEMEQANTEHPLRLDKTQVAQTA